MPFLLSLGEGSVSWGWGSVDEVDGPCAEVGLAAAVCGGGDSVPDHFGEPAGDASGRPAGAEAGQVEAHPPDHVVLRTRAGADELVVDGEQQRGVQPLVER